MTPLLEVSPWEIDRERVIPMSHLLVHSLASILPGIRGPEGQQVIFTAHDFRRIFTTEIVDGGPPIHIGAKLLGHLDSRRLSDIWRSIRRR